MAGIRRWPRRAPPLAPKLSPAEIGTLPVLQDNGQSNTPIAQTRGVRAGTVRYHARRHGRPDGRPGKPRTADARGDVIDQRVRSPPPHGPAAEPPRPVPVRALFAWRRGDHADAGSYQSVRRCVRARYPRPRRRPFRRVATPPGARARVAWGAFADLDSGDGPPARYGCVRVRSHARTAARIGCRRLDPLAWHHAPTAAVRRLGGIPAVPRLDNRTTGVGHGAGPWGAVNAAYRRYARGLGVHSDAGRPRGPADKGTVANKVGVRKRRLRLAGQYSGPRKLDHRLSY